MTWSADDAKIIKEALTRARFGGRARPQEWDWPPQASKALIAKYNRSRDAVTKALPAKLAFRPQGKPAPPLSHDDDSADDGTPWSYRERLPPEDASAELVTVVELVLKAPTSA